jgi:hypothetical protein
MAETIPDRVRKRVVERPDAFRTIAKLDYGTLDRLLKSIEGDGRPRLAERPAGFRTTVEEPLEEAGIS